MMQAPVITAALLVSPVLMVCLAFCLLAVLLMLILRGGERKQKCARLLARLKTLPEDAHRLKYLRKINPYVFEELLLLALKQQGMTVIHNPCYSGDGGPDGQVMINGERWLIQAKRYGRTIRPAHIDAFGELLRREGCRGGFYSYRSYRVGQPGQADTVAGYRTCQRSASAETAERNITDR